MAEKEYFKQADQAVERQKELAKAGIVSKIIVDPMQGIFPSHSDVEEVCLVIEERDDNLESAS